MQLRADVSLILPQVNKNPANRSATAINIDKSKKF
jgi:hypothetical protein